MLEAGLDLGAGRLVRGHLGLVVRRGPVEVRGDRALLVVEPLQEQLERLFRGGRQPAELRPGAGSRRRQPVTAAQKPARRRSGWAGCRGRPGRRTTCAPCPSAGSPVVGGAHAAGLGDQAEDEAAGRAAWSSGRRTATPAPRRRAASISVAAVAGSSTWRSRCTRGVCSLEPLDAQVVGAGGWHQRRELALLPALRSALEAGHGGPEGRARLVGVAGEVEEGDEPERGHAVLRRAARSRCRSRRLRTGGPSAWLAGPVQHRARPARSGRRRPRPRRCRRPAG